MTERKPTNGDWIEWVVLAGAAVAVAAQLTWVGRMIWRAVSG